MNKKRSPGRPHGTGLPLEEKKRNRVDLWLTDAQYEKYEALGGNDWARETIEAASVPDKKGLPK